MTTMTIAHATALAAEDEPIFEQAVALAAAMKARLFTVNAHDEAHPSAYAPDATRVLSKWGRPADSVEHEAMIHSCCEDPVDTLLDALRRVKPDLIVAGTHQRKGMARLFEGSRAEAIIGNVDTPTMVFPTEAKSLVDAHGRFDLRRVVIPVGDAACAKAALQHVDRLLAATASMSLEVVLVVAESASVPSIELPVRDGLYARIVTTDADLTEALIEQSQGACLVVMATRGTDSLTDSLLGTHTEHMLRETRCPVLVVPMK